MNIKKITQKDSQGNMMSFEFDVPPMKEVPKYDHPGFPKGTDTVPAWLTPGEFVMNAEATRMFKPQIEAMNKAGQSVQRAQGGTIPQYNACGGKVKYHAGGAMVTEPTGIDDQYDPLVIPEDPLADMMRSSPVVTEPTGLSPEEEEWLRIQRANKLQEQYQYEMQNPINRGIPEPAGVEYKADGGTILDPAYLESLLGGFGKVDPNLVTDPVIFNDPKMLNAIAKTESGYDNTAVSPVGAEGMYQWMPESAKDPGYGVQGGFNTQDPIASRQATQAYLKGIMEQNPGMTYEEALQAYNWGPGNMNKYMNPQVPMRRPEMPNETKAYANRVMDNYVDSLPPSGDSPVPSPYGNNVDPISIPMPEEPLSSIEEAELNGVPIFGNPSSNQELEEMAKRIAAGETDQVVKEQISKNAIEVPVPEIAKRFDEEVSGIIEVDGAPPDLVGNTMKSIQDATKDSKTPTDTPDKVTETGKEIADSNPEALSKVEQFMKDFGLSDLIDNKELGRMAVMYLGSRALGYDHGGSLNFAAKHYVQRVDAKQANKQAIAKAAMKDYTSESIKKYLDSGDISDLKLKVTTDFNKDFKVFSIDGKPVNGYWDDTSQRFYARTEKGNVAIPNNTPLWKEDTSAKDYATWKKDLSTDLNGEIDRIFPAGERPDQFPTGNVLANETAAFFKDAGYSIKDANTLAAMNSVSYIALKNMAKYAADNEDKEVRIEPFLTQAMAESMVGSDFNIFMIDDTEKDINEQEYVDVKNIARVMTNIDRIASNATDNSVEARAKKEQLVTKAVTVWRNMPDDKKAQYPPNDGENGFYVFLRSIVGDNEITPEEQAVLDGR